MPAQVSRDEVLRLIERRRAQLVEVLPRAEYEEERLPDAVHVPLKSLSPDAVAVLDRARPVVVYCWDGL